jgi:ArsR family transcriptional regulator, arsenate/arsenite/antimonite-responsive transcriptional repressor
VILYFYYYRSMKSTITKEPDQPSARYADMFSALGTECRLRILRLLLAAHPDGLVVGDIQSELGIPASTLSHHLERLKSEGLAVVRRESTFLRYSANTAALEELLGFLFAECCSRSKALKAEVVIEACGMKPKEHRKPKRRKQAGGG